MPFDHHVLTKDGAFAPRMGEDGLSQGHGWSQAGDGSNLRSFTGFFENPVFMIVVVLSLLWFRLFCLEICTGLENDFYVKPSCYHIVTKGAPFGYQDDWCQTWHENGHLASVHSGVEELALQSRLEENTKYWTGLKMSGKKQYGCDWNYMSWTDGTEISYKPSVVCRFSYDPKCIFITQDNWEDSGCNSPFKAICKFTPHCSTNCHGRGDCVGDEVCRCEHPFVPPDCSVTYEDLPSCDGISAANTSVCNGHGICVDEDICECFEGYIGAFCDKKDQVWYSFFGDQAVIIPIAISVSIFVLLVYGCCVLVDFFIMIRNCKTVERGGHFFAFNWTRKPSRHGGSGGWSSSDESDLSSSDDDSYVGSSDSSSSTARLNTNRRRGYGGRQKQQKQGRRGVRRNNISRSGVSLNEDDRMAGSLREKQIPTEEDYNQNRFIVDGFLENELIKDENDLI